MTEPRVPIDELGFLASPDLTHKDKLVQLTSAATGVESPTELAAVLSMAVASVKQSLRRAGELDETAEAELVETVTSAIIDVCQMDRRSMRPQDWKLVAKVAADISDAGATADEVRLRARNLPARLKLPVTPGSIDKYWAQLGDPSPFSPRKVYG